MYDEVYVHYELPDTPPEEVKDVFFQTKEFDCLLRVYSITQDGRLKLYGEDQNYHGDMNFYTIGYNYIAHFEHGQLKSIERIPYGRY